MRNMDGIESVDDEADAWMLALGAGFEEDDLMEALQEKFPSLKQFAEMYGVAAGDPEVIERYDSELRSWRDTQSWKQHFREEGLEEGLEQGRRETLVSLHDKGAISSEVAAEELGISVGEFLALLDQKH